MNGTCLNIGSPLAVLGSVVTDGTGYGTIQVVVPPGTADTYGHLQAVRQDGSTWYVSPVRQALVLNAGGDLDEDFISNADEVLVHGTNAGSADTTTTA